MANNKLESRVGDGDKGWPCLSAILAPRVRACSRTPNRLLFTAEGRQRIISHPKIGSTPNTSSTSPGGWWFGSAGIAVALAAVGGVVVAAKKLKPGSEAGPLKVLSRTSLSPRHSVYLLKVGDRVLIVGTGPQGAPSLLGEMDRDEDRTTDAA